MAEANAQKSPALTKDSAAVDALVAAMTDAWNSGDAKAFSARFAEDGSFTNVFGMIHYGHEAFEKRHTEILQTIFRGSTCKQTIARIRFVRPDVAIAEVDAEVSKFQSLPPGLHVAPDGVLRTKLQLVLVKQKSEWWITAFYNVAITPTPPRP